ncbi:MAG: pyrroloquinoline quinone-dependent dehydrogenase [Paracoccus sp. (in: a-proteobacteria)]|nr:pyrroloquinoline quinone-dependent dehydrogenase [Paracoccus sp. (in: a-proteobacteria)]
MQLIAAGGTWYYAIAALLMVAASVALLLGYAAAGVRLQALLVAATFLWALWEIAGKGFLPMWGLDLAARLGVISALYLLSALLLSLGRTGRDAQRRKRTAVAMTAAVGVAAAATVAMYWERTVPPSGDGRPTLEQPPQMLAGLNGETEWTAFGGSPHGQRFTPAVQITPQNVSDLTEAWRFRTGDLPDSDRIFFSSQNTPILAEGRLFACSPSNKVFALDPATGEELWSYDPEMREEDMESLFSVACRSVAHYRVPDAAGQCASRVYLATVDSRLTALDAETGQTCTDFGEQGTVDLSVGMDLQEVGFASSTSGPALVGDALIVGQQVSDNQRRDAPSGVVRAYDPVTGQLRWHWDALLQGRSRDGLAEGEIYPRGTPNVWNVISGDPEAGIVYLGTGNSANDHFGGTRTPEEDRFTAAVVAVDLATGEAIWEYATVTHDLWDYDIGAQPIIADVMIDGARRRAVIQGTKTGSLFVLDAATGAPLTEIEQRPAPQGALPGDWVNPTQPQSVRYANLSGLPGPDPERLDPRHAFGVSSLDAAMCRLEFQRMEYRGIYTPPTDAPGGMLLFPGTVGGMNWGGLGYDRDRNILITNHSRLPNKVVMHPRDEVDDLPVGMGGARPDQAIAPHYFSPWGVDRPMWLSPLSVPCIAPPWGILAATDMDSGELLWSKPIGTGFDIGPLGLPTFLKIPMGTPNLGGSVVTASGLTFIAAAQDNWLRAFETATGRLLWQGRLPAGGQASPMSYVAEGRQYVVIAATGHGQLQTEIGDHIVAFALPM